MRNKVVLIGLLLCMMSLPLFAQDGGSGIRFFKGSYDEAVEKASKEKKLIFIDFYTEWCGPCLNMADNVFILPEVGMLYNDNFVCLKIDAEKGVGVELARQFKVSSFPTYIFVNPRKPSDILHRSGGNKSAKFFMMDAQFALTPKQNSVYMDACYKSGKYNDKFLQTYILQRRAVGASDQAEQLFDELMARGHKLTEPSIWNVYTECIDGYNNVYAREVLGDYSKFVELFGKIAVDEKLSEVTRYAPNDMLQTMCNFEGKKLNMKMNFLSDAFRNKQYDAVGGLIDGLLTNPTQNQAALYDRLLFYLRIIPGRKAEELPWKWRVKQVELLRYMAYNVKDKREPVYHYNYALGLEFLIRLSQESGNAIPSYLTATPTKGKAQYDLRSAELKQKPKANAKVKKR